MTHDDPEQGPLSAEERRVAALLAEHFADHDNPDCLACDLEGYAAGTLDVAGRAEVEGHLATCSVCREALPAVRDLVASGALTMAPFDPAPFQRRTLAVVPAVRPPAPSAPPAPPALTARRHLWLRPALLAAAAVVTVGTVALVGAPERGSVPKGGDPTAPSVGEVASDALFLSVSRDDLVFRAEAHQRLRDGDLVRFFYTAQADGYLAIVHVNRDHAVTRLHPTSAATSAPIAAGTEVALEGGVRVDAGDACEWVVAVFSEAALDLPAVEHALRTLSVADPTSCSWYATVPGARSVVVFPIRQ